MSAATPCILIVDDELINRKLLEALLRPEGYRTVCAASGPEALAAVAAEAPDLILLDIMMPGMDGYQVANALKSHHATSNIPIIMVSAHGDRGERLAGLDSGAEEFLTKPVDRAELWLRVRNLLRLKAFNDFLVGQSSILEQQVQARTADLQRFRTAMDATADAIMLVERASMRLVEVNATACRLLGYTREELLQLGPAELGAGTPERLADAYDELIEGAASSALSPVELRRKDGSLMKGEVHRQALRSGNDWIIVAVVRDVTERQATEQRLHRLAHFDTLTGLPNRTLFYATLEKTLVQANSNARLVAVLFIDLDFFKNVNDTLGHAFGDELLRQFSARLVGCVRVRDTVGRLGGDEIGVILMMQKTQQDAVIVVNKIREALREPFCLQGHEMVVTASIGIAIYPVDAQDRDTLIKYADTAMYRAKQAGRDTYRFFTSQMNSDVLARLELETALRRAIENDEFELYYQPKVQLSSGRTAGVEALLRWRRPGAGLVSPAEFIPVLEDTGLIVKVGTWVIATACSQIGRWIKSAIGPLQISVNVSGRQFIEGDLDADVLEALAANDIPANLLELELTESSLMANTGRTIATLQNLKRHGVQISIDDFGTGYSSLAYLRRFPIDKLKIDIAFIRDVTTNPDAAAITLAIISMAHSLKLEVVAEGVETAAQLSYLRRHHCDQIQGYFFSPPLPLDQLEQLLREEKRLPAQDDGGGPPRQTLLLVDDEASVLSSLKRLLRQDRYHILAAGSAAEGFELLAMNPVQLILCDQRMPGMSGTVFLTRVKEMYPDTLRIVLSGYTDLESIMDAINCGAIYRFYTKPWDNNHLRGQVRDAFRHHRLLHDKAQDERMAHEAKTSLGRPHAFVPSQRAPHTFINRKRLMPFAAAAPAQGAPCAVDVDGDGDGGGGRAIDTLEAFVREGLALGEAAVVVATAPHLAALAERLGGHGVDLDAARAGGQYVPLGAEETLAAFMVDGWPDDALFASEVKAVLTRAQAAGRRVRVFGEMAAILMARGDSTATMRLDYLWNQMCEQQSLSLFAPPAPSAQPAP
ncbi:EAL domain-containing protein [Massilia glaciei]|uniref:EAL domain-containing protein n=1 Tax=Massilia glaciei TaxID=1524097 RepID=UPI0015E821DB|nr:EAL domain-containing protein [Massilia glaciei]